MATFLNPDQRRTLAAISDTFTASLTDEEAQQLITSSAGALVGGVHASAEDHARSVTAFAKASGSALGVPASVEDALVRHCPPAQVKEVGLLLSAMGTRIGMLVLTGNFCAFADLGRPEREAAMVAMSGSMIEAKRKAFCSLKALMALHSWAYTRGDSLWQAVGYAGPEPKETAAAAAAAAGRDEYVFQTMNSTVHADMDLQFDVVVVGSGCGGSVVAAELAEAGHRVLVVEKGVYYQRSEMSGVEGEALDKLYETGGLLKTEDTGVSVLAGATFGGGSTVNWACSLRTPEHVRREWAVDHGLKFFTPGSETFEASVNSVCHRLGVKTEGIAHSANNQLFKDACQSLGYDCAITGQNMADVSPNPASAHFIANGDRYGLKQSTLETYLQDAAKAKTPAVFADRCFTERVVHEKGRASGIVAHIVGADGVTKYRLNVKAPLVVVSAGSINSPALLLRSKLPNRHGQIGKNLRLHPVNAIIGWMPDDAKDVAIWEGAPMTTVSNVLEAGRDGDGYGSKLECPVLHVGIAASASTFFGARSFKETMLNLRKAFVTIVLTRDRGSGEVRLDAQGQPSLYYPFDEHDRNSMLDGMDKCMRIAAAAGAAGVSTGQLEFGKETEGRVALPPVGTPEREQALEAAIQLMRKLAFPNYKAGLFSAHQMGTCRMGTKPTSSVVQDTGETWEVKGLYVSDASVFPTSSGANPMMTNMTISHFISQGLKEKLSKEKASTGNVSAQSRL